MTLDTGLRAGESAGTEAGVREREVLPRVRQPVVRWIEFLAFMGLVVVAAVGLWLIVGNDATDGSFEAAEEMRFERIGQAAAVITAQQLARLEDAVTPSVGAPFEMAEMARFERIAEAAGAPTLLSDGSSSYAESLRLNLLRPTGGIHLDGFDVAEMLRFSRIGGYAQAITLDEFVEP
ncbi:MAG TPA: hypothetical protein VIY70_08855 [Acidimicrobiia bacterium]